MYFTPETKSSISSSDTNKNSAYSNNNNHISSKSVINKLFSITDYLLSYVIDFRNRAISEINSFKLFTSKPNKNIVNDNCIPPTSSNNLSLYKDIDDDDDVDNNKIFDNDLIDNTNNLDEQLAKTGSISMSAIKNYGATCWLAAGLKFLMLSHGYQIVKTARENSEKEPYIAILKLFSKLYTHKKISDSTMINFLTQLYIYCGHSDNENIPGTNTIYNLINDSFIKNNTGNIVCYPQLIKQCDASEFVAAFILFLDIAGESNSLKEKLITERYLDINLLAKMGIYTDKPRLISKIHEKPNRNILTAIEKKYKQEQDVNIDKTSVINSICSDEDSNNLNNFSKDEQQKLSSFFADPQNKDIKDIAIKVIYKKELIANLDLVESITINFQAAKDIYFHKNTTVLNEMFRKNYPYKTFRVLNSVDNQYYNITAKVTSCIAHQGNTILGGHYISLSINNNNQIILHNDEQNQIIETTKNLAFCLKKQSLTPVVVRYIIIDKHLISNNYLSHVEQPINVNTTTSYREKLATFGNISMSPIKNYGATDRLNASIKLLSTIYGNKIKAKSTELLTTANTEQEKTLYITILKLFSMLDTQEETSDDIVNFLKQMYVYRENLAQDDKNINETEALCYFVKNAVTKDNLGNVSITPELIEQCEADEFIENFIRFMRISDESNSIDEKFITEKYLTTNFLEYAGVSKNEPKLISINHEKPHRNVLTSVFNKYKKRDTITIDKDSVLNSMYSNNDEICINDFSADEKQKISNFFTTEAIENAPGIANYQRVFIANTNKLEAITIKFCLNDKHSKKNKEFHKILNKNYPYIIFTVLDSTDNQFYKIKFKAVSAVASHTSTKHHIASSINHKNQIIMHDNMENLQVETSTDLAEIYTQKSYIPLIMAFVVIDKQLKYS